MISLDVIQPYPADREMPSPNFGPRRGSSILGVILHATADEGNEAGSLSWMQAPKSQASCHLLVERDGTVVRLVEDAKRAWHAGVASFRGRTDVNSITLGIEIANRNDGQEPYTEAQYRRLVEIGAHYARQGLTPADFVGHADVAPLRKTDPAGFDWARFRSGVAMAIADPPGAAVPEVVPGVPAIVPGLASVPRPPLVTVPPNLTPVPVPDAPAPRDWSEPEPSPSLWERITHPFRSFSMATTTVTVQAKPWYLSKTVIFNVLVAIATVLGALQGIVSHLPFVLPGGVAGTLAFLVAVVNFILRFFSSQPVASSAKPVEKTVQAPG